MVLHAEVRLAVVVLMVGSADAGYETPPLVERSTGGGLYLWLPTASYVDDWFSRARRGGCPRRDRTRGHRVGDSAISRSRSRRPRMERRHLSSRFHLVGRRAKQG